MKKFVFSIIIPTLNEEKYLPRLLESIKKQTYRHIEVIVVDGSSKDKTIERAKEYAQQLPALSVVVSPVRSLPAQRNYGASLARGEWLMFVDADSELLPYCLERVAEYINTHTVSFLTPWMRPDSEDIGDASIVLFWNLVLEGLVRIKRQLAPGPCAVVRKSAFDAVGGYDLAHDFNEDADFSLRLYEQGVVLHILRETLYVVSFRRLRSQGKLRVAQQYIQAGLPIVFLNRSLQKMPGYIMGGHMYTMKKKPIKLSVLRKFNTQVRRLTREFFR